MPRNRLAATIQHRDFAKKGEIRRGIEIAETQPSTNTVLRLMRADSRPATKFSAPLTKPNETTKDSTWRKEDFGTPKSRAATTDSTLPYAPSPTPGAVN